MTRYWTCTRVSRGVKCKRKNPRRNTYCQLCGKRRPASLDKPSKAKHIKGTYEEYIERQGGEFCMICGREPKSGKRLHRDHDHARGVDRGLLDFHCNRQLRTWMTVEWMEAAIAYLKRYEAAYDNVDGAQGVASESRSATAKDSVVCSPDGFSPDAPSPPERCGEAA